MQIFILGMHRSGTSAVARLLNMMGTYFSPEGFELPAQDENIKGFWERSDIMELNDTILASSNSSWLNPISFNLRKIPTKELNNYSSQISSIILKLDAHRPWMIKDPRMCLLFPLWENHIELPVSIFVYRNPIQIAKSLAKRNQFPVHFGIALWEFYTISALKALKDQKTIFIQFPKLLESPVPAVKELHEKLISSGVSTLRMPSEKEISSFLDPNLFHEKCGRDLYDNYLNENQKRLAVHLDHCEDYLDSGNFEMSQGSLETIKSYIELLESRESNAKLSASLESCKNDRDTLHSSIKNMDEEYKKLITSLTSSKKNITSLSSDLRDLDQENENLRLTLDTTQKAFTHIDAQFSATKKDNKNLDLTLRTTQNDYANLDTQFTAAQKEHEKINLTLQTTQKDYANLEVQFAAAKKENERINLTLRKTQNDYADLSEELTATKKENEKLNLTLQTTQNDYANLDAQFTAAQKENEKLDLTLQTTQNDYANLDTQFIAAQKENEKLDLTLQTTQNDYVNLDTQFTAAQKENEKLDLTLQTTQNDYANLDTQFTAAQKENEKLIKVEKDLTALVQEITIREKSLTEICSILDGQLKSLQNDNNKFNDYIAQLESWLKELKRDTDDIFSSWRWKTGHIFISTIEALLLRFDVKTAEDHLHEILEEFTQQKTKSNASSSPIQKQSHQTNLDTFCQLLLLALKNPQQTINILNIDRLKNLYITLVRQSSRDQATIFDHYIKLYSKKTISHGISTNPKPLSKTITIPQHDTPVVSIIIPVYNNYELTIACLLSIAETKDEVPFEIIIGDDNSTDETKDIQNNIANLTVIRHEKNLGFLKNCIATAKHAKGKFLLFLNNDTTVLPNWLISLVTVAEHNDKVGLIGSKLLFPDGQLQEAGGIIWQDGSGWNYGRGDDPTKPEYNYLKDVDYVSGACFLTPTKIWKEIGGFDEQFSPAYYEDTDYAFAVRERGFRVLYQPASEIIHHEGMSCGTDLECGIKKYQRVNNKKFRTKWQEVLKNEHSVNGVDVFTARDRSKKKKTILVIDHYVPQFDKDAGSRSTFQYLQWFAESGFNVKFIGDNFYQDEPYTTALQQLGIEVLYGNWYANNWRKWIKENAKHLNYIYLHRPHIAPNYIDYLRKETNAKIIYFGHDLHYLRLERQYEIEHNESLKKMAVEWKKKEFELFTKADVIYYPSGIEVNEILKEFPQNCVRAIPLYIFDKINISPNSFKEREHLLFVGGFRHLPNVDAMLWFVDHIFPLLQKQLPGIKLYVAGTHMPDEIEKLGSEKIAILGEVSDEHLENLYKQVKLTVVPLRYGAGIKGKILESLHFQVPVVTTSIGAEGFPEAEKYLKIANDTSDFAREIFTIYSNKSLWVKQVKNGVNALNTHFSKKRAKSIWEKDIDFDVRH